MEGFPGKRLLEMISNGKRKAKWEGEKRGKEECSITWFI